MLDFMVRLYFKPSVCLISILLALIFFRLSYWQWTRHQEKQSYISGLQSKLKEPITKFQEIPKSSLTSEIFRRVILQGEFDYEHEVILRNREYDSMPGVYTLTPLKYKDPDNSDSYILVNRGFIPLTFSTKENRKKVNNPKGTVTIVGLIKEAQSRKFLAPEDPESGGANPWVDAWLRVDIENINKQLLYKLAPVYLESIVNNLEASDPAEKEKQIVRFTAERADLLIPSEKMFSMVSNEDNLDPKKYPISVFDPVLPPTRHLGYVFEWGFMAIATLLMGLVLQLKP